ncbi:cation:proton antiporter [Aliidiomarina sp. Khilg15.8]
MVDALTNWLAGNFSDSAATVLILGLILSLSISADAVAKRTQIPRISLLVLLGLAIAVVQQIFLQQSAGELLGELEEPLIQLALVMVAFLLGSELTIARLRKTGPMIFFISLTVVLCSYIVVAGGLLVLGIPLAAAIALAAISVATDPAAVNESIDDGRKSITAKIVLGIVAIDDAWGILVFGLSMAALGWALSNDGALQLTHALWELGGAILLGTAVGVPAAWLSGRLKQGQPILIEALAIMFLLAGLSSVFAVSELLAAMVAGALVANLSFHHERSFKEIEHIEWPFLVFFFVLSGASIDLYSIPEAGLTIVAYIFLRLLGRYFGGMIAVKFLQQQSNAKQAKSLHSSIGLTLTPQAGVAIGMALLAAERFPEYGSLILSTVVASTVFFEIIGPFYIRRIATHAAS